MIGVQRHELLSGICQAWKLGQGTSPYKSAVQPPHLICLFVCVFVSWASEVVFLLCFVLMFPWCIHRYSVALLMLFFKSLSDLLIALNFQCVALFSFLICSKCYRSETSAETHPQPRARGRDLFDWQLRLTAALWKSPLRRQLLLYSFKKKNQDWKLSLSLNSPVFC